jgi:L-ascorbate metabolism protein UlaG (beta-lactamase superfamily)
MSDEMLFLRPNVQVSPLFVNWYAWPYLIPPASAARNITERHFPIMKDYIGNPALHAEAVKNPRMSGGPFVDYGGKRVDEIASLLADTEARFPHLLALSTAISVLDSLLRQEAKGGSLQPLYSKVPDALRGYVELVYDLNSNPSFRLIEGLLYRSPYYDRNAQSLMLALTTGDDRPFVLSTPYLPDARSLEWKVSFDSPEIDWLFRSKKEQRSWSEIQAHIDIPENKYGLLRSMFSDRTPPSHQRYSGPNIRWRYFGHACILIEADGISMLFDPVLSYTYDTALPRYTYDDLPEYIDYVLITHNHQDHILFETLLQLRHKVKTIVVPFAKGGTLQDPSMKAIFDNMGFTNVVELKELQSFTFENGMIIGLPFLGEHADLDIQSKLGYMVKIGGRSIMLLADSCNIEPTLYKHLRNELGTVDALFIGMECDGAPLTWLYGPLLTGKIDRKSDLSRRLAGSDYQQAMDIVKHFCPKEIYVYAMGQEPWLNYVMNIKYTEQSRPIIESNKLIAQCRSRGLTAERLFGEKEILLNY